LPFCWEGLVFNALEADAGPVDVVEDYCQDEQRQAAQSDY